MHADLKKALGLLGRFGSTFEFTEFINDLGQINHSMTKADLANLRTAIEHIEAAQREAEQIVDAVSGCDLNQLRNLVASHNLTELADFDHSTETERRFRDIDKDPDIDYMGIAQQDTTDQYRDLVYAAESDLNALNACINGAVEALEELEGIDG